MEVLQENVPASCSPAPRFKAWLVNFKKLKSTADTHPGPDDALFAEPECLWRDLLHAVAGLCSVALPDMEETAIYSSLTRSGSKAIILTAEHSDVLKLKTESQSSRSQSHSVTSATTTTTEQLKQHDDSRTAECDQKTVSSSKHGATSQCRDGDIGDGDTSDADAGDIGDGGCDSTELESSFHEIFSASEASETESVAEDDEFSEGRRQFLEACRSRRRQLSPTSTAGPEDVVAGCGCFLRLSDRPGGSAVQVLLLAVRHRWRRAGLGSFLLQTMKDPALVGHYDALLTFADHKVERFFTIHGFSDDPIITARYSAMVDRWENSSLMAYIPPFSVSSPGSDEVASSTGSIAALSLCEENFKSWRSSAIASYCKQLSLMQRLRHEVVLLHGKLESREADIRMLTQQLQKALRDKSTLDLEFANYRKHTQRLLCEATVDKTQQWLDSVQHTA